MSRASIEADVDAPAVPDIRLGFVSARSASRRGGIWTDAGLARLKSLKLEVLYLDGTLITKAGLEHLKDMPLQVLSYSGTKAAADGVEGFRKKPATP